MQPDLIIAVESSGIATSIALGQVSDACILTLLGERSTTSDRPSTSQMLPAVQDLLSHAGFAASRVRIVAFVRGPGSFTGLRVGATFASMMQSALGCQLVGVPTFDVLARNILAAPDRPNRVATVLDAKRGQVYAAVYDREISQSGAESVRESRPAGLHDAAAWFAALPRPCAIIGAGVAKHLDSISAAGLSDAILAEQFSVRRAAELLAIAAEHAACNDFTPPYDVTPIYLRPPECEEVYEQRRAAAIARRS